MTTSRKLAFIICLGTSLIGCRAKPAPDAGFLQVTQLMKKDKDFPFNRIYLNSKYSDKGYTEIYVAPVNIDRMLPLIIWEVASLAYLFPDDVKKNHRLLAQYAHDAFVKAVEKDSSRRFTIVDKAGPDTVVVELALVQLTASKPILYAASYISLYPWGVILIAPIVFNSEDQANGLIAIEA